MEDDEEKDIDLIELLKVKTEKMHSPNVSVPKSCLFREVGNKQKCSRVPGELQIAAEEVLIRKDHEEFKCQLPDVPKSTFLMVFSPDGKKVASTHGNHNVYVTDLTSGKNMQTLKGHPRTPWCIAFHPSSNQILASGCLGGQVRVWDLHGGSEIWTAEGQTVIASLAFHPVDRMLVIASYNELHFWDWSQPEPFAKCCTANEKEKVRYVAFDQLGHKLITGVANAPSRNTSMWDRVAAPQPPPQTPQLDQERRITNYRYNICYRYMVEQYEQLVQRYYDLSHARTMPTMDRGTDPMDLEVEGTRNAETSAGASSTPSTSRAATPSRLEALRQTAANLRLAQSVEAARLQISQGTARILPHTRHCYQSCAIHQIDPLDPVIPLTRSQMTLTDNGHCCCCRVQPGQPCTHSQSSGSLLGSESIAPPTTGRFIAGTDERTASRSSSQYLTPDNNLPRSSQYLTTDGPFRHNVMHGVTYNSHSSSSSQSDSVSRQPSELNSEDSSHSSSVESVRVRRVHTFRNSEQSEGSTSNSENVSRQSSGVQASPRSSTSLSVSIGNLGFGGSEGESTSFDNGSESGAVNLNPPCPDEPFVIRPLSGLPQENIGFNIRRPSSQAGSEDSDIIIPNVGTGSAPRGTGVRIRRRRLFHEYMNLSDESTLSSSQHNSPDDMNNDINNLELSADELLTDDLPREARDQSSRPSSPPRHSSPSSNQPFSRNFSESDESRQRTPLEALWAQQRNLEHSLSSLSTSWERLSASFQQRSDARVAGNNGGGSGAGSSETERERTNAPVMFDAVSRLRRRLSAYRAHTQRERQRECVLSVLSAESETVERLHRLNELLERPERQRRLFVSRRSAFQQARSSNSSQQQQQQQQQQSPRLPEIGGVRYGIELLSRHIDNMQRLCRARLEILQLQQIRRMWEDLQSQIYALHGTVREVTGSRGTVRNASALLGEVLVGLRSNSGENSNSANATAGGSFASSSGSGSGSSAQRESAGDGDGIAAGPAQGSRSDGDSGNESDQGHDLITDDESDGGVEQTEGRTRSPVLPFRRVPRFPRPMLARPSLLKRFRPGTISYRLNDAVYRRNLQVQNPGTSRRTRSNPIQFMGRGERESESSNVSGDSSTGTSDRGGHGTHARGVKRKSRETDRPRGSASVAGPSTSSSAEPSSHRNFAESMRETIMQLESMLWRQRARSALRGIRMTRFIRQREERMLRNLWDTESSHESGRDDLSEGDSNQPNAAPEEDNSEGEWSRETARRRARQILMVMVDSLTQFFEQDSLSRRQTNEALHDRICNLYVLLQLALNLTDLLLVQLVTSRRELESQRLNLIPGGSSAANERESWASRCSSRCVRPHVHSRHWRQPPENWRRGLRRNLPPIPHPLTREPRRSQPTTSGPSGEGSSSGGGGGPRPTTGGGSRGLPHRHSAVYSNIRSAMLAHRLSVPIVRVNDLPPPDPPLIPPRSRPPSPPLPYNPLSRLLASGYSRNPNPLDDSSEESSPQDHRSESFLLMRGYGTTSDVLNDAVFSTAPNHRIQAWDFSTFSIPDISNPDKNLVVNECRIHNDASVDVSSDGHLLVTLLPSGRLSMLGVYSLQWGTLGQLLYRTSFEQNAVSVSLSPTTRHLAVGLASRRVAVTQSERHRHNHTIAQIFRLEGAKHGGSSQGRLELLRNLRLNWNLGGYMSLNCIRWAPNPGQGLVYGTNTGLLKLLR